MFKKMNIYKFQ